jgi:lipopolysaccharide export system protein LptA
MSITRTISALFLAAAGGLVWAQTNASPVPAVTTTEISSDSAVFDNNSHRLIYQNHVLVIDPKVKLRCDRLTVDLPPAGQSRPTNIVAESAVVIDFLDDKGLTNHVTANKAVYAYHVVGTLTNGTVTFTGTPGNPPKVVTPQADIVSEPLVWDLVKDQYRLTNEVITIRQSAMKGTNGSPMSFFK